MVVSWRTDLKRWKHAARPVSMKDFLINKVVFHGVKSSFDSV
jgi:hypothetical protein